MRHAAYLSTSRHGIFYFRMPIPQFLNPSHKSADLKLSLGTRCPKVASTLARLLIVTGQTLLAQPTVQAMKYPEIRQHVQNHFRQRLVKFKAVVAEAGPLSNDRLNALRGVIQAAEGDLDTFVGLTYIGDEDRLLSEFCEKECISEQFSPEDRQLVLRTYQQAYLQHAKTALEYNDSASRFEFGDRPGPSISTSAVVTAATDSLSEVATRHIQEGERSNLWMAKTVTEKRDALSLLTQLIKDQPVADITKADARMVKSALQKLPKNRNKSPATKGLTLDAMLQMDGLPVASIRTLNAYVSHFQTFFKWSVEQGFAQENVFTGMRFRMPKRDKAVQRDAFTTAQLGVMFKHLVENPDGLVPKDEHKWVTLIAMLTGARLNEVAQLGVADLLLQDGVWCFSFTTDGDDNKHLKTEASKRLVPVHDDLLACGLQSFMAAGRAKGHARLFPALSYDKQNGYGRNVGRWFNESFLVKLGMKKATLSFHCLRHTMNTQLGQKNVPEHIQKAILGHTQSGMSYNTYFKEGFLPEQLLPEINKFAF